MCALPRAVLQAHAESQLPSQRYKYTRQLPAKVNPIIPQDASQLSVPEGIDRMLDFPSTFLELNAPMQRPPALGNPLFGYSCHPLPPPVVLEKAAQTAKPETRSKLRELQKLLDEERSKRQAVEAKLAALNSR